MTRYLITQSRSSTQKKILGAIASLHELKKEIVKIKKHKNKLGSKMITAGVSGLRQAFYAHLKASQETTKPICSYLLLFYAAECGLKSIWLRRHNLTTTNQIPDQTLLSDGHKLDRWVKELKIPASKIGNTPHFHLCKGGSNLEVEKAHQAWRYHVKINSQDEQELVKWLESLCDWIKESINR